jgi:anti-sigma factor RsiW
MNHGQAWELIPWFVNGSASTEQRERIEQHMEQCPQCRAEIAAQRELMQAMRTPPAVESMPHASLQKLWTRIDGGEGAMPAPVLVDAPQRRRPGLARWLAAAVVVQAVLLGVLCFALLDARGNGNGNGRGEFRTVSATAPAASTVPAVRAVFSPDMTLGELQALLERAHLRIVNGPSAEGVLTLALAAQGDDAAQALAILRAHPAARFAEPIGR